MTMIPFPKDAPEEARVKWSIADCHAREIEYRKREIWRLNKEIAGLLLLHRHGTAEKETP